LWEIGSWQLKWNIFPSSFISWFEFHYVLLCILLLHLLLWWYSKILPKLISHNMGMLTQSILVKLICAIIKLILKTIKSLNCHFLLCLLFNLWSLFGFMLSPIVFSILCHHFLHSTQPVTLFFQFWFLSFLFTKSRFLRLYWLNLYRRLYWSWRWSWRRSRNFCWLLRFFLRFLPKSTSSHFFC